MKKHLRRPIARVIAPLAIVSLALAACSSSSTNSSEDTPNTEPETGGEIVVAVAAEPGLLDPHAVSFTYASAIVRQVVDSLTQQDIDTGEIVPWLATDWEINDDATEYVFTLRDDVTFSDGEELNAEVVVANFEDILELNGGPTAYIGGLASVEAIGDYEVKFNFDTPNTSFLQATSNVRLGILSPTTLAETDQADREAGDIIGSGPFVIDSIDGQEIVLTKRDDYAWPAEGTPNDGAAYLDSVIFQIVPESTVRTGSVISGDIDIDLEVGAEQIEQARAADVTLVEAPQYGLSHTLLANIAEDSLWSDQTLRNALAVAIDQEEIGAALSEQHRPATSVTTHASAFYTDFSDLLGGEAFADVDEANAALDEAGWELGADGYREKDGERLQASVLLRPHASREAALQVVQQQAKAVGIDVVIDVRDSAAATVGEDDGDYDFVLWSQSRNDPDNLRAYFDPNQGRNPTRATDDGSELYELLAAQAAEAEVSERQAIVDRINQIVLNTSIAIPLFEQGALVAVGEKVTSFELDVSNLPLLQSTAIG